jgi:apolipoprotein N-acyltransferase
VIRDPRGLHGLTLACVSVALLSVSIRPWGWGGLALVALAPMMVAVSLEPRAWKAGCYTALATMGALLVALEGLALEHIAVFAIGVVGYGSLFFLVGWIAASVRARTARWSPLVVVVLWLTLEFLLGQRWLLGAYANPALAVGYSQSDTPLLRLAAWGGVTGVSAAVLIVNACVATLALRRRLTVLVAPVALFVCAAFVPISGVEATGRAFRVGVAQGSFPTTTYDIADFDAGTRREIAQRYAVLVARLQARDADLIVLPETAFGGWQHDLDVSREIRSALSGASFALVGAKFAPEKGVGYNAVLEWQREAGSLKNVYAKRFTIPLTESGYRPWQRSGVVPLGGVGFGLGICWENVYASLARSSVLEGAQVLAYLNGLLWAGFTATPSLQLRVSVFRAVETGRDVIHATAGGPSAVVRADGSVQVATAQGREATLIGTVQPRAGVTPYVALGDWVGWSASCVTAALLCWIAFSQSRLRASFAKGRSKWSGKQQSPSLQKK